MELNGKKQKKTYGEYDRALLENHLLVNKKPVQKLN